MCQRVTQIEERDASRKVWGMDAPEVLACMAGAWFLLALLVAGSAGCQSSLSLECAGPVLGAKYLPSGRMAVWSFTRPVRGLNTKSFRETKAVLEVWDPEKPDAPPARIWRPMLPGDGCAVTDGLVAFPAGADTAESWPLKWDVEQPGVKVAELTSGAVVAEFPVEHGWRVGSIGASPRGKYVAWTEEYWERIHELDEFRLKVADLQHKEVILNLTVKKENVYQKVSQLVFSPDETRLAFGAWEGASGAGCASVSEGRILWQTSEHGGGWRIAFCPDGKTFFTILGSTLLRFETETGRMIWSTEVECADVWWTHGYDRLQALDVSPDGRYVAVFAEFQRKAMVWEVASGKLVRQLRVAQRSGEGELFFDRQMRGLWVAGPGENQLRLVRVEWPDSQN